MCLLYVCVQEGGYKSSVAEQQFAPNKIAFTFVELGSRGFCVK